MCRAFLRISFLTASVFFIACSPDSSQITSPTSPGQNTPQQPFSPAIPLTSNDWLTAYNGFGYVNFAADASFIEYAPQAAADPGTTHAVLLLTNRHNANPIANFRATIQVSTLQQIRTPTPNAWETFWFFFNYKLDTNGKKQTNYFTLKPNGYELGTAYDDIGQTFLATGGTPTLTIGLTNTIVLEMYNGILTVTVDGSPVFSYDNSVQVNKMYLHAGNFGLYCEDAKVKVFGVKIEPL